MTRAQANVDLRSLVDGDEVKSIPYNVCIYNKANSKLEAFYGYNALQIVAPLSSTPYCLGRAHRPIILGMPGEILMPSKLLDKPLSRSKSLFLLSV